MGWSSNLWYFSFALIFIVVCIIELQVVLGLLGVVGQVGVAWPSSVSVWFACCNVNWTWPKPNALFISFCWVCPKNDRVHHRLHGPNRGWDLMHWMTTMMKWSAPVSCRDVPKVLHLKKNGFHWIVKGVANCCHSLHQKLNVRSDIIHYYRVPLTLHLEGTHWLIRNNYQIFSDGETKLLFGRDNLSGRTRANRVIIKEMNELIMNQRYKFR